MSDLIERATQNELIVIRDALKEYAISMRMRDNHVIYTKEEMHNKLIAELEPLQYAAHPFVIACGLVAEAQARIK
jgi:hypothetical protein